MKIGGQRRLVKLDDVNRVLSGNPNVKLRFVVSGLITDDQRSERLLRFILEGDQPSNALVSDLQIFEFWFGDPQVVVILGIAGLHIENLQIDQRIGRLGHLLDGICRVSAA